MRRARVLPAIVALVSALGVGAAPPTPVAAASAVPCPTVAATAPHTKAIEVYGAPGSFSELACTMRATTSGDTFEAREWDGPAWPGGTAAWFTRVAGDGSVFTGMMQQTIAQGSPTSDEMGVGRFDPATGEFEFLDVTSGSGFGDISDVQEIGTDEVGFVSAWPSHGTGRPVFGTFTENGGSWAHDPTADRDSAQVCGVGQNCDSPQEIAALPNGDLALAAWYGKILIVDDDGNGLGLYDLPAPTDSRLMILPRAIEAKQTLETDGTSRFAVVYDIMFDANGSAPGGTQGYRPALQVFSWDPATATIAPVTAPMVGPAGTYGANPALTYADSTTATVPPSSTPGRLGYGAATWDRDGNLWAAATPLDGPPTSGGPTVVFAANGPVLSGTSCAFTSTGGLVDYQTRCAGSTSLSGTAQITPTFDLVQSDDPADDRVFALASLSGVVMPIEEDPAPGFNFRTTRGPIRLDAGAYNRDPFTPPGGGSPVNVSTLVNKGTIRDGIMWVSVATTPGSQPSTPYQDVPLPQFLVRIDLAKIGSEWVAGSANQGPYGTTALSGTAGGSPTTFVKRMFDRFLGLAPNQSQLDGYSDQLRGRSVPLQSPAEVAYGFWCAFSTATANAACGSSVPADDGRDGRARAISRLYRAAFDRWPDGPGLTFWNGDSRTLSQVASYFAGSAEFTTKYGSLGNQAFVEQLYLNVLDRPGDSAGITYWTNELNNGASRGSVLLSFSRSAELKANVNRQLRWLLFGWRWKGTVPTAAELDVYARAEDPCTTGGSWPCYGAPVVAASIMGRP